MAKKAQSITTLGGLIEALKQLQAVNVLPLDTEVILEITGDEGISSATLKDVSVDQDETHTCNRCEHSHKGPVYVKLKADQ